MAKIPRGVSALLRALNFRCARCEELSDLHEAEWKDLLSFADLAHLTIPLLKACGDELPAWVRCRIEQNVTDNTRRFERIKQAYGEFVDAFGGAGAEHVVLKGFTLAPDFTEHPRFRLQSDIDVYCPPESISLAHDGLLRLGYEPCKSFDFSVADHLPTLVRNVPWEWRGNYYDPEIPVGFELHFCLWNERTTRLHPKGVDRFWSRRVYKRVDDFRFPALEDVDNLGYSALNLTRNLFHDGASPHQIYELARFLQIHAEDAPFWKRWREAHDDSVRTLESVSFRLASGCFGCSLASELSEEIDRLPAGTQAWLDAFGLTPLTSLLSRRKSGIWLYLSLLESKSDGLPLARRRLFPTQLPRVETMDVPDPTPEDTDRRRSPLRTRAKYFAFFLSRLGHHAWILPSTLWEGCRWWWSSKKLGKEFWTFWAASFLFDLGMFIFFVLYNLYLLDRGFKEDFVGLIVSASAVGSVAGAIPAGMLARRLGLKESLLLCLALGSAISALRSVLATRASLLTLAFFGGAAFTIWAICISPVIASLTNARNRSFGFSLIFSSGIATGFFGGELGGRLPGWLVRIHPFITQQGSKQMALLIACAIVALAIWPASHLKLISTSASEKRFFPRSPFLVRFLPAMAAWSLVTGAFSPFFNTYFSHYLQMPLERIGLITSVSQVSQALAVLAAPLIFQRFGLVTGIVYTQIATAIALASLAAVRGASTAAVVYVGYMALQWMSEPGMYSLLMSRVAPEEQTGASTLNFLVISLAQAIAAALAGASFVRFGYFVVLAAIAVVALSAALLFRVLLEGKSPEATQLHHSPSHSASARGDFTESIEG